MSREGQDAQRVVAVQSFVRARVVTIGEVSKNSWLAIVEMDEEVASYSGDTRCSIPTGSGVARRSTITTARLTLEVVWIANGACPTR